MDRTRVSSVLEGGARLQLRDGRSVEIRPIRSTDAEAVQAFVRNLSEHARRMRFLSSIRELTPRMLRSLTEVDGRLASVLVALTRDGRGERIVALAQYAASEDGESCDLALVIADGWRGLRLGGGLMDMLLETAREAGFARAEGDVLRGNDAMLGLARAFGFAVAHNPRDAMTLKLARDLDPPSDFPSSLRRGAAAISLPAS